MIDLEYSHVRQLRRAFVAQAAEKELPDIMHCDWACDAAVCAVKLFEHDGWTAFWYERGDKKANNHWGIGCKTARIRAFQILQRSGVLIWKDEDQHAKLAPHWKRFFNRELKKIKDHL